mmetsp:Transcript_11817/g.20219  ORF Transcript_11817/g.20219 Transcript_11817/m.20219 type:complete len:201 (+) Transcript_11817:134-736(+)
MARSCTSVKEASAMAASSSRPSMACISAGRRKKSLHAAARSSRRTACDDSSLNSSMRGSKRYGDSGMTCPYSDTIQSSAHLASGSSTDLRKAPMPLMIRSETSGYFRRRFFIEMIDSAETYEMSTSRNFMSCSTTSPAELVTRTPILPIAWTAPRATETSGSVTYSAISSMASATLASEAIAVRMSSLSSLTHGGSLYRQ